MKNLIFLSTLLITLLFLNSCSDDGTNDLNSAKIAAEKNDHKEADKLFLQAVEKAKAKGKKSIAYGDNTSGYSTYLLQQQKYKEAAQYAQEAINAFEGKEEKEDQIKYATAIDQLGATHFKQKAYKKAQPLFEQSKAQFKKLAGKNSVSYAYSCNSLGEVFYHLDDKKKAKKLYLEADKILQSQDINKIEGEVYANNCIDLAQIARDNSEFDNAHKHYLKAIELYDKSMGKNNPKRANILANVAHMYDENLSDKDKAIEYYTKADKAYKNSKEKSSVNHAINHDNLSFYYSKHKKYKKALEHQLKAINMAEQSEGKNSTYYANFNQNLGNTYEAMNKMDKAKVQYLKSQKIFAKVFGKNSEEYNTISEHISDYYPQ